MPRGSTAVAKEDEHQDESERAFGDHARGGREVMRELRRAERDRAPNVFREQEAHQIRGGTGARELRGPVRKRFKSAELARDPEADGHRRIQMAAGNVRERSDQDGVGESLRDGDSGEAHGGRSAGAEELVGADRTDGNKNENEGADEFRNELLRSGVHAGASVNPRGRGVLRFSGRP